MADTVHRDIAGAGEFRVSGYLEAAVRHLPAALLPGVVLQPILALTEQLPGAITSFFGFECPLSGRIASADFLLCSTREEGHARILAGAHDSIDLTPALLGHAAWQRVRAFSREWERSDSPLGDHIMNIWLEFDVGSNAEALNCPSVFFGTHPPSAASRRADTWAVVRASLGVLAPAAAQGVRGRALQRLCEGLPDGTHAFQIGVMFARQVSAIRVCLRGLPPHSAGAVLETLGWPGPRADLEGLLAALETRAERLDIDLDLGDSLAAKIGIECYFGTDAHTISRLQRVGDFLVARGLCTPAQLEALIRYNGLTHQDSDRATWPAYLAAVAAAQGPGMASCLCRWVHHIKVVHEPGKPLMAKAYLAIEHHAIERRRLAAAIDVARTHLRR